MLAALPRALSQRPYVNKAVGVVSTVYRSVVMFSQRLSWLQTMKFPKISTSYGDTVFDVWKVRHKYLSPENHFQAAQFACHVRCSLRWSLSLMPVWICIHDSMQRITCYSYSISDSCHCAPIQRDATRKASPLSLILGNRERSQNYNHELLSGRARRTRL